MFNNTGLVKNITREKKKYSAHRIIKNKIKIKNSKIDLVFKCIL